MCVRLWCVCCVVCTLHATHCSADNVNYFVLVPVLNIGVSLVTAHVFEEGLIVWNGLY